MLGLNAVERLIKGFWTLRDYDFLAGCITRIILGPIYLSFSILLVIAVLSTVIMLQITQITLPSPV
jgi:hypothetical protein